jgi:hypothetical protein
MDLSVLAPQKDIRQKITDHMGKDPATFAIVTEQFEKYHHPNLHLALEEYISDSSRSATLIGIQAGALLGFGGTTLSEIVAPKTMVNMVGLGGVKEGPVQHTTIKLDGDKQLACVQVALYLIRSSNPLTVFLRPQQMDFSGQGGIYLDVLAETRSIAEDFMNRMRKAINANNVYRGKILAVGQGVAIGTSVSGAAANGIEFKTLPPVTRDKIILPNGLLDRIERQTVAVGKYSQSLLKAGRKLKRGILLHGKPGTGKTLTAMYLASVMEERTVLIATGRGVGAIRATCEIARWLEPSMVVIEDVDLIAEERSRQDVCNNALLLELMNEMDGLADDCDVLFVLTTNRPEILEPALANRPGRVDQAYEIPLPDAECRAKLFELYGRGLTMKIDNMEHYVKRTKGASGAFISELLRKAALFAAPDGDPIVVQDKHLDEALHELLIAGGALTKSILGFAANGQGD